MRKLMATPSGQTGLSGWKHASRTDRLIYHHMGIPYYRTDVDESNAITGGKLFALKLGSQGLSMVHAYGSRETIGLEVEPILISGSTGIEKYAVHVAYSLIAWDNSSVAGLADIDPTTGL